MSPANPDIQKSLKESQVEAGDRRGLSRRLLRALKPDQERGRLDESNSVNGFDQGEGEWGPTPIRYRNIWFINYRQEHDNRHTAYTFGVDRDDGLARSIWRGITSDRHPPIR